MKCICLECGCKFTREQASFRKEEPELKYSEPEMCCPNCESFDIEQKEEDEE